MIWLLLIGILVFNVVYMFIPRRFTMRAAMEAIKTGYNPVREFRVRITRKNPDGSVFHGESLLTLAEANAVIAAFTEETRNV